MNRDRIFLYMANPMINSRRFPLFLPPIVYAVAALLAGCHRSTGAPVPPLAAQELPPSLHGLTTQPTELTMAVGTQRLFSALVTPARSDVRYSMRFTTSAPHVATVDSSGAVSAVAEGRAVVTVVVRSDGGAGLGATTLSGTMQLTVTRP
jgi:Bacterial Ig-like domain (group 2)